MLLNILATVFLLVLLGPAVCVIVADPRSYRRGRDVVEVAVLLASVVVIVCAVWR